MARTPWFFAFTGLVFLPALAAHAEVPVPATGAARPAPVPAARPVPAPPRPATAPAAAPSPTAPAAKPATPVPNPQPVPGAAAARPAQPLGTALVGAGPATPGGDPAGGAFTLAQATAGLKGVGGLVATFEIEHEKQKLGVLTCELFADKAPVTVANFVGLARGLRPWLDPRSKQWQRKPLFDNNLFHRVIPEFMIQAGDPRCSVDVYCMGYPGTGEPGYAIPNEIRPELRFDRPGILAMANRGPDTNGSQFLITERETPWLDGSYTIFGQCGDVETIKKISAVPTIGRDLPEHQIFIKKVTISRKAK